MIGGLHGLDRAGSGPGLIAARDLAPLQEAVHTLETHAAEGPPWSLRWGLYQGDALVDEASELYLQTLASRVITPLAAASEEELQRLARRSRGGGELARDEYWQAVRTLRLYILLTREGEAVHVLSEGERRWLAPALARAWGGAEEADPLTLAASEALVERDLPRLGAGGDAARGAALPARDPRIVERARVILRRSARGRLWVDDLADRPSAAARRSGSPPLPPPRAGFRTRTERSGRPSPARAGPTSTASSAARATPRSASSASTWSPPR
ncbi:MAG: hypothetical protein H6710_16565 [Myxococcales bacterium]|nr:hypothetical protein [Myxococcales bacterium]